MFPNQKYKFNKAQFQYSTQYRIRAKYISLIEVQHQLYFQIFIILLTLSNMHLINYLLVFIFLVIDQITDLILLFIVQNESKKLNFEFKKSRLYQTQIAQSLFNIFSLAMVYLITLYQPNLLYLIPTFPLLYCGSAFYYYYLDKEALESLKFLNIISIAKSIFLLICTVNVSFKLSGILHWNWVQTFWIFWIGIILIYIVAMILAVITLSKVIQYAMDRIQIIQQEAYLYLWLTISCVGLSTSGLIFCYNLIEHLENEQSDFQYCIVFAASFACVFIILSILLREIIINQISIILQEDLPINQQHQFHQHPTSRQDTSRQLPQLIQRISRTYFNPVKNGYHRKAASSQNPGSEVFKQSDNKNLIEQKIQSKQQEQQTNQKSNSVILTIENNNQNVVDCSISISSQNGMCLICYDNQSNAVFMKCGHGGLCYQCAMDIWNKKGECHLCRQKIDSVLQLNLQEKVGNCYKVISTTQMIKE